MQQVADITEHTKNILMHTEINCDAKGKQGVQDIYLLPSVIVEGGKGLEKESQTLQVQERLPDPS